MRPIVPEELKYYDPFDKNHSEKILTHFNVKVDVRKEVRGDSNWGYVWKCGGVQLAPADWLTEEQARAVVGLAVYLYCSGVHPGLDDRLAMAYFGHNRPRLT